MYKSSDAKRGLHRLKIECATSSTPMLTFGLSGVSLDTRSYTTLEGIPHANKHREHAHIDQCLPTGPEIRVCDYADCLSKLCLNTGRNRDHKAYELLLDRDNLILWEFIVPFFVLSTILLGLLSRITAAQIRTTQLNLMKFLKHNAPESRVFSGRDSEATILSRRSENPGFVSSSFSAISAGQVSQKPEELQPV